jgi:hypothetical protein
MNNKKDMVEIIKVSKISIPVQNNNLGSEILKTILYKKNNQYCCSQGIGEDEWVINNGTMINVQDAFQVYFDFNEIEQQLL